ncbi:hypothetical protein SUVZ_14G1500 [Saccharomyces uvarum]|uniref:Topoisomerase I damage affected protein 7 n=1 Tax=Saccharomyces uvarum TaxID=230603 RepID=A0ABN8WK88_SACUV|nr:hypothetical protein SUVZ_14G1500 [Saccharomyces uvarum]
MPKLDSSQTTSTSSSSSRPSSSSDVPTSAYTSSFSSDNTYSSEQTTYTSSSNVPMTTSPPTTTATSTTPLTSSSQTYSMGVVSSSEDSQTIYYFYTQAYDITGSSTTFTTGLPTTVALAKSVVSSFSVPSSTITADMSFYQHWLDGGLDSNQNQGTSKSNTGTIVGSIVGSIGGILVCAVIVWFLLFRKRKSKREFKENSSFCHEIGRRTGFPTTAQARETSVHAQDPGAQQTNTESSSTNNPFSNEFNFRARGTAPAPPPRNGITLDNSSQNISNYSMNPDNRFSYVSSFTYSSLGSSTQGGFSALSSNSINLGHGLNNNDSNEERGSAQDNSHGFLREII